MFAAVLYSFVLTAGDTWAAGTLALAALVLFVVYLVARRNLFHVAVNRSALYGLQQKMTVLGVRRPQLP